MLITLRLCWTADAVAMRRKFRSITQNAVVRQSRWAAARANHVGALSLFGAQAFFNGNAVPSEKRDSALQEFGKPRLTLPKSYLNTARRPDDYCIVIIR
jgi:hypothetical protein